MPKSKNKQTENRPSKAARKNKKKASMSDMDTADSSDSSSKDFLIEEKEIDKSFSAKLKSHYFLSLAICFLGVVGCYSGYAVLQESLLSDKSKKMNTNFVMGLQQILAVAISCTIIKVCNMGALLDGFSKGDLLVGTLNFSTMFCSNYALKFVNYPFMALAKSAKILPVILTGWLSGVYELERSQVIIAIAISAGLVVFNMGKMKGGFADDSLFGIFLVLLSLLFDGFVNSQTDKNHKGKKRAFAYHTMLYNSLVGVAGNAIFFAVAYYWNGDDTVARVFADLNLLRDVILISLCGAVGQIFIYLTISLHDCYKLSIMTTSRKCLTVVISAFLFDHSFSQSQWVGASLVLASTVSEVYLGNKRKQAKAQEQVTQEMLAAAMKKVN